MTQQPLRIGSSSSVLHKAGLGLHQAWMWSTFMSGPLVYQASVNSGRSPEGTFLTYLIVHTAALLGVYLLSGVVQSRAKAGLAWLSGAATSIATVVVVTEVPGLLIPATGLAACGAAVTVTLWGATYASGNSSSNALSYGVSIGIGTLGFFALSYLPGPYASGLAAVFPLASAALLSRSSGLISDPPKPASDGEEKSQLPGVFLAILACFYVVGGLMYKLLYVAAGSPGEVVRLYWSTNLAYFAAAGAACWLLARRDDMDLRRVCEAALPALGAGFVLFLMLQETSKWISLSLLQVGFALFDAYSWLVISYLAGRSGRPIRAFAQGFSLVTASILLGTVLMFPLSAAWTAPDQRVTAGLGAGIMFLATFVLRLDGGTFAGWSQRRKDAGVEPSVVPVPVPARVTASLDSEGFAALYRLTVREREVLDLLLSGRNNPYIREALNVSANTLKTHLRNIYQKAGVGDRQELLTLFAAGASVRRLEKASS